MMPTPGTVFTGGGGEAWAPRLYHVREKAVETHDVVTLTLTADEDNGEPFRAGQFNMLYAFGIGEIPISISGRVESGGELMHTIRAVGPVSRALCRLEPGDPVGVRGPFGTEWPLAAAEGRDVIVLAGGLGLAPLRVSILHLAGHAERYGQVNVLYGARTPEDMIFADDVEHWSSTRASIHFETTVDHATPAWRGHVGVVPDLLDRVCADFHDAVVFLCGPEVMMRFSIDALESRGVQRERIYVAMERNMKCATGFCGHCMLGPFFVCRDGSVFRYDRISHFFRQRNF